MIHDVDLVYFSSPASHFISIWTSFVSSGLFLVVTMLSPRFRVLLRLLVYDMCLDTYIRTVGCIHTIVRFLTRIRRNDGTENFGGFVYVLDGFPQRDFVLWVFMYPINIILFYGYHAKGFHAPSLPPRASTPVYASRQSRHSIFLFQELSHLSYH